MSPGTPQAKPIKSSNAVEWIWWILRRRSRFRVSGDSMRPTLNPGDVVLFVPIRDSTKPLMEGDIVLCKHPYKEGIKLIKRVKHFTADGQCFVIGDNQRESTDSRSFGALNQDAVLGKITSIQFSAKGLQTGHK